MKRLTSTVVLCVPLNVAHSKGNCMHIEKEKLENEII